MGGAGQITDMSHDVLIRIDQRLALVGLTESRAALEAGLSDSAIRNVRRALKKGEDAKFSARTLEALAPVLRTSASWLLEGGDDPEVDPTLSEIIRCWRSLTQTQKEALLAVVTGFRAETPLGGRG